MPHVERLQCEADYLKTDANQAFTQDEQGILSRLTSPVYLCPQRILGDTVESSLPWVNRCITQLIFVSICNEVPATLSRWMKCRDLSSANCPHFRWSCTQLTLAHIPQLDEQQIINGITKWESGLSGTLRRFVQTRSNAEKRNTRSFSWPEIAQGNPATTVFGCMRENNDSLVIGSITTLKQT